MKIPRQYLLSDLLHLKTFCNEGLDHGLGVCAWMYPPVHRILGWVTKPSSLSLQRCVWRLDQLKGISYQQVFVNGYSSESDQSTIDRFPTLVEAVLLNKNGQKVASIVDFLFDTKTGKILYYLISRSNPNLPGTSRWRLDLNRIIDQEAGCVSSNISILDELPLLKSSIRQEILNKSKKFRDNILDISNLANEKLEGWLDDASFDSEDNNFSKFTNLDDNDEYSYTRDYTKSSIYDENEEDPWI